MFPTFISTNLSSAEKIIVSLHMGAIPFYYPSIKGLCIYNKPLIRIPISQPIATSFLHFSFVEPPFVALGVLIPQSRRKKKKPKKTMTVQLMGRSWACWKKMVKVHGDHCPQKVGSSRAYINQYIVTVPSTFSLVYNICIYIYIFIHKLPHKNCPIAT